MRERNWTYKELDILRFNYGKMSDEELGKKLKRTAGAVQTKANMIGLKKEKVCLWTPQKLKLLTDFFPIMFNDALAKWLGVSIRTVTRKARELGLKKRDDFYQLKRDVWVERQREALKKVECATRFKKGHHASPATEFKKGQKLSPAILTKRTETRKRNLAKKQAV